MAVFWARLSGPFSWFIPALAGAFEQPYRRFMVFNTLGVFIGIGEFLVLGYLLGNNLEGITTWLYQLGYIPLTLAIFLVAGVLWHQYGRNRRSRRGN